jgi:dihydrodipicolinate synthase/N-acetylneuraminate lyase
MMEAQPFIAAAKHLLARRGVRIQPDMRRPMRPLSNEEASSLDAAFDAARSAVAG